MEPVEVDPLRGVEGVAVPAHPPLGFGAVTGKTQFLVIKCI